MLLKFGPAPKPICSREHPLSIQERKLRLIRFTFESLDLSDDCQVASAIRLKEFLGLLSKLFETRLGGKRPRGRKRGFGHDVLLSAASCRMARRARHEPKEGTPT